MGLSIRTLLIWLLVLAVPAQAAAAATMAFCGPNHHGGGQASVSHQVVTGEHAHHGSAAQAPHGHPGVATQSDVDAPAATAGTADAAQGQADKHKCSACASCCSAGAILSTVPTVPAADVSPTVFITVVPSVSAFAADGPDRPPRIFLA